MTGRRSDTRPWQAYLHGVDGSVVVVTGRVAAWLLTHTDLARHRPVVRGADPEVDAVLMALTAAGNGWRTSAASATGGTSFAPSPEPAGSSEVMTTTEAADLLGITDRAIRAACTDHRLNATQIDGCWRITRPDLETYRRTRNAA